VELAQEVQHAVGHEDLSVLDAFLREMYGEQPDLWTDELSGAERLRCITNYLTRMRLTDIDGRLEFKFKDALDAPMPEGFKPWFEYESLAAKTHHIIFGHWAALQGKQLMPTFRM
jgi:bis(5'-nucleosyl)-tetraphosphatase (symmetrical)